MRKKLRTYIDSPLVTLKTSKLLYIPIIGINNAGKSNILNGIIGIKILLAQKNECTKKDVIIKLFGKRSVIRKAKFI